MRLTCPNCDAQYEVPGEAIPAEGREVQCSNCGNLWFQAHPDHPRHVFPEKPDAGETTDVISDYDPVDGPAQGIDTAAGDLMKTRDDVDEEEEESAQASEHDALPLRREIDPIVIEILRAEADREVKLRAAEKSGARQTRGDPGQAPENDLADKTQDPAGGPQAKPERDALPDLAAPNSGPSQEIPPDVPVEKTANSRTGHAGGFTRGFALVIIVASVFVVVYVWADRISEHIPQATPILETYVANANQMRVWLDSTLNAYIPK